MISYDLKERQLCRNSYNLRKRNNMFDCYFDIRVECSHIRELSRKRQMRVNFYKSKDLTIFVHSVKCNPIVV